MKKSYIILFAIAALGLSSWMQPLIDIPHTSKITIGGEDIISNAKTGEIVTVERSSLQDADMLSVAMNFTGYLADGATCQVVITNQDGKTIAGKNIVDAGKDFDASIAVHDLLTNENFKNATMLNVMFVIQDAQEKSINETYLVGRIEIL